ncbi:hypothetical protein [Hyphococcus sp.]|uniref:hypothetical protein n=1 Tax=Hyphococcus sp. TaxID=2038636 RepID=UPI003CCBB66A
MPHNPLLYMPCALWARALDELHFRTEGKSHESGAFLLGRNAPEGRIVEDVVYYDDLDPNAYSSGVVVLHADSFSRLWKLCGERRQTVVADIHVHPRGAGQSRADRNNPMIARKGHLAIIVPDFADPPVSLQRIGFYQYLGQHQWRSFSGEQIERYLTLTN